jgi:hypothetical protein
MPNQISLILQPFGFALAVTPGETYRIVLNRFNAFRAPDKQIRALYYTPRQSQFAEGSVFRNIKMPIDLDTTITQNTTLWTV